MYPISFSIYKTPKRPLRVSLEGRVRRVTLTPTLPHLLALHSVTVPYDLLGFLHMILTCSL